MHLALHGKHPAFGDFIDHGMAPDTSRALAKWCDSVAEDLCTLWGQGWQARWDAAPDIGFWLGADVLGEPLTGVLRPSHDRSGRRSFLVAGLAGVRTPAPTQADFEARILSDLATRIPTGHAGISRFAGVCALAEMVRLPDRQQAEQSPSDPALAGTNGDSLTAQLRKAAAADAIHEQRARSHWWICPPEDDAAGGAPTWLGCHHMPTAKDLARLLVSAANQDPDQTADKIVEEDG